MAEPAVADFSRLAPDERFFPLEEFTRTLAYSWSRRRELWQYAPPLGSEELRVEISRRLSEIGLTRSPEEILVVSGAQQGLDLLFRTFTDPGDLVAMESPTYSGALSLARLARSGPAAAADGSRRAGSARALRDAARSSAT